MVEISPTALREIKRIKLNRHPDSSLRLRVKSGGCSGLFYDLKFEFIETNSGDRQVEIDGISIIIDLESWKYIENLKLDYCEDLMGGGFRFHNPKVKNTCGCGISFAEVE